MSKSLNKFEKQNKLKELKISEQSQVSNSDSQVREKEPLGEGISRDLEQMKQDMLSISTLEDGTDQN